MQEQSQPSQQSVQDWYQESASLSDAQHSSHPSIEDNAAANLVAMSKPNMFMDDMGVHSNDAWYPAKVPIPISNICILIFAESSASVGKRPDRLCITSGVAEASAVQQTSYTEHVSQAWCTASSQN